LATLVPVTLLAGRNKTHLKHSLPQFLLSWPSLLLSGAIELWTDCMKLSERRLRNSNNTRKGESKVSISLSLALVRSEFRSSKSGRALWEVCSVYVRVFKFISRLIRRLLGQSRLPSSRGAFAFPSSCDQFASTTNASRSDCSSIERKFYICEVGLWKREGWRLVKRMGNRSSRLPRFSALVLLFKKD